MGVAGAVGLLKRNGHRWSHRRTLRDTSVVIDVTSAFYWFVNKKLIEKSGTAGYKMDLYGTSMIELGTFYRDFFKRLRERNCRPIIVWDGYRKSLYPFGKIASKTQYLEASSRGALNRLKNGIFNQLTSLPDLADNCLKEIINECGFGADQLHQAIHEVYPVLQRLARDNKCPVITSHSDFIFSDVPEGFIWFEELEMPRDATSDFNCDVYLHANMMKYYNLHDHDYNHHHNNHEKSEAVRCLSVLLRDDFVREHHATVNGVLRLKKSPFPLEESNRGTATRRLGYILENWPKNLNSVQAIRDALIDNLQSDHRDSERELKGDFGATWDCYSHAPDFHSCDLARTFESSHDHIGLLHDVLVHRESTANFLANLTMTDFRRTNIQDIETFRSTYSLNDRFVQYLIERIRAPAAQLFDRERDSMHYRQLNTNNQMALLAAPLSRNVLFVLLHFSEQKLENFATQLSNNFHIDIENSRRLALLLYLARFVLKLVGRDNYDNTDQLEIQKGGHQRRERSRSKSTSKGSGSGGRRGVSAGGRSSSSNSDEHSPKSKYERTELRKKYLDAILNSYVYHMGRTHLLGDQSSQEVPADIRVARGKIDEIAKRPPSLQAAQKSEDYITCKHLIEALNSVLHGYKELNSLYNFVGPNILVNKYYDGVLIYKLMTRMSKTLAGHLLIFDETLYQELIDF